MKKLLTLFCIPLLVSCTTGWFKLNFDQKVYDENKALWEKNNFQNYAFSQEVFSGSLGPQPKLRVVVKNNVLDTIFVQSENTENIEIEKLLHFKSISECYDFIERVATDCKKNIDNPDEVMKGADIKVKYDSQYHYPTEIDCVGHYSGDLAGGLNTHITITDFEVLQ